MILDLVVDKIIFFKIRYECITKFKFQILYLVINFLII